MLLDPDSADIIAGLLGLIVLLWIIATIMLPFYVQKMRNLMGDTYNLMLKDHAGTVRSIIAAEDTKKAVDELLATVQQIEQQARRQGDLLDAFLKKIRVE